MPVYVYRNLTTGDTFEVEQRMVEPALVVDPVTGDPVKRLIQPVGIAFKGSGFYVTDSRSKNGRKAPASADAKGDTAAATDAAPAAAKSEKGEKSDSSSTDKPAAAPSTPAPKAKAATVSGGAAD